MNEYENISTPAWLTLASSERIHVRARPSANILLAIILVGFLILVAASSAFAAAGMTTVGMRVALLLIAFLMIAIAIGFLIIRGREYVLTNERVYRASGPASKRVTAVDLERVEDVLLEQSTWQQWLGVATIRFELDEGESVTFDLVEHPQVVYEHALKLR